MLAARVAAGSALALSCALVFAAQPNGPVPASAKPSEVSFQFERSGVPVPRFTLRVREDGTGSYQAEEEASPADGGTVAYEATQKIDRTLTLTQPTVAKLLKTARELNHFEMVCESKAKNIANTGKKTLSYTGADGAGSCTYNYSDDKDVRMLTDTFLAIAYTMDEGRRLAFLHRYDRLGLDEEMAALVQAAQTGRALELGTIAPVLSAIAADGAVMQRVRLQAAQLLKMGENNKI